eukprot:TRINITY_DN130_c0_g4_i1.p1 TRINITY_DN130_c0_g4~~TRINITY_DN130_c0_g4_i1.p1  ORF type:complete len:2472 (+),score=825.32 TRINITY_DN130_c0_g4_i1:83-7498(+)
MDTVAAAADTVAAAPPPRPPPRPGSFQRREPPARSPPRLLSGSGGRVGLGATRPRPQSSNVLGTRTVPFQELPRLPAQPGSAPAQPQTDLGDLQPQPPRTLSARRKVLVTPPAGHITPQKRPRRGRPALQLQSIFPDERPGASPSSLSPPAGSSPSPGRSDPTPPGGARTSLGVAVGQGNIFTPPMADDDDLDDAKSTASNVSARWAEWEDESKKLKPKSPDKKGVVPRRPSRNGRPGGRGQQAKGKAAPPGRRGGRRLNDVRNLVPAIQAPQERWKELDHLSGAEGSPTAGASPSCCKCHQRLRAARQQLKECADELWQAQLQLVGLREDVKRMRRTLAKARGHHRSLPTAQWEWCQPPILEGDSETWFPYPADDAALLEHAFPSGTFETRDLTFNLRDATYFFDFLHMTQLNKETQEERKMRRRVPTPPPQTRPKPEPLDEALVRPEARALPGDANVKHFASMLRSPPRNRLPPPPSREDKSASPDAQKVVQIVGSMWGNEWSDERQLEATEHLVDWVQAANVGSWTFERPEFVRFIKYLCPMFEVPPTERIGLGETFSKLFMEVLRQSQKKEGDKATVQLVLEALVEACEPAVLQRVIKKWMEARGQTAASNDGGMPKYGDGIADAKAPEDVKTVTFYEAGYVPPTDVHQTVDNLATWHTPQGRIWQDGDIERFQGNCQLMSEIHSADQPAAVVLPLYLYSVSLYRPVLWAVWISPKRCPPRGRWASVRNVALLDSYAQWEKTQRIEQIVAQDVERHYQARVADIESQAVGMDDQVYSGLMEKARQDAERYRIQRTEEMAIDPQGFFLKLDKKMFDGISGVATPECGTAQYIKIDWVQKLQMDIWFRDTFCIVRFDNKRRGQAKWSPCHDTTAWLPAFEVVGPTKMEITKQAKPQPRAAGWGKLKKAVATGTVAGAINETIKASPEQFFRHTVDRLPPPGILDYIHSRRSEEHLRWAMPAWECKPAINRVARKLIDKCYTVADQQKHDLGLEKEFRGILKQDKLLVQDNLLAASNVGDIAGMMRVIADAKCDPGNPATPQLIAHALDIQYLKWDDRVFLLSLSGSRFVVMECASERLTELSRVKDGHDDQPYWHLNYAMRMRQMGKEKTTLALAAVSGYAGKYHAPKPPTSAPADRSELTWQLPVDLVHEKKKNQRCRWDIAGGDLEQGCWRVYPEDKPDGISLENKDCSFELCTWMLGQLTPLIYHTDRAMMELKNVSEHKVGYSVCPPPKGIKNYRGLANVSLPSSVYGQGKVVLWGQYSSSTTDRGVASAFAGGATACAVFNLVGKSCRCIAQWSRFAREKEWLYPPGVKFRVVSALTEEQQQILGRQNLQLFSMEEIDEFQALEIYVRGVVPTVAGGEKGAEQVMQLFRIMQSLTSHHADEALVRALDPLGGSLYTTAGQYLVRALVTRVRANPVCFNQALHIAAAKGIVECVPLFLDTSSEPRLGARADVTARTQHGHTALHLAALGSHFVMCKHLLMAHARPMMLGCGFVALEYAAMKRDYDTVRLLRPVTPGNRIPQRLADYQPRVQVIGDKELFKKEVLAAGLPWDEAKLKHCGKEATVTLFDAGSAGADLPVFWLKFEQGGTADKLPVTVFKQRLRRSRGDFGDSGHTEDGPPVEPTLHPTGAMADLAEAKVEEPSKEDFQLFNLSVHVEVERAPIVYKYVTDNGVASLVNDAVQQLVVQLPDTATRFFRDYFQEKMGVAPMPVKDHIINLAETSFVVYLSYPSAQLPPHQKMPVAMTLISPVEHVTPFANFAIRAAAPLEDEEEGRQVQQYLPASCDVRHMFPIHKRLAHCFLSLIGRKVEPFTTGSKRDPTLDAVYHIPKIIFPGRHSDKGNMALFFRDPDKDIALNAAVVDEVAEKERKAGPVDTLYNESFPDEPQGPPAAEIWGPGEFRITGRELQELEATTRIATTAALPPRLFTELTAMTSHPKYVWFFSLFRAIPLLSIEDKQLWITLKDMYERRAQIETPIVEDLEFERRRACAHVGADMNQHLDHLGSIDFQIEQHRLWQENSLQHLAYFERERDLSEATLMFVQWRDGVLDAPRDYGFDTEEQVRTVFAESLTELCCSVAVSQQGYCFTRGVHGAANQLCPKTPQPITFISAAGIDFNSPTSTLCEAPKYFLRNQAALGPDVPGYEGWKGFRRGGQERLLERIKDMYRIIFESAQHHGVRNLSMLPMGLGVFLLNVNEADRDTVRELYFRAQFELLSERQYGFENYYINPGPNGTKARETLDAGIGDGKGGNFNDPQRGRFMRCNIVFHDRDAKFLAVELAKHRMAPALLNPCDCSGIFLGQIGNYWETGRAMYYVGEEDLAATTTLLLGHSGISDCLTRAGCIIHEGSRTVSRPARPRLRDKPKKTAKEKEKDKEQKPKLKDTLEATARALQRNVRPRRRSRRGSEHGDLESSLGMSASKASETPSLPSSSPWHAQKQDSSAPGEGSQVRKLLPASVGDEQTQGAGTG